MSFARLFAFWEKNFRIAAMADEYSLFREHLRRLEDESVPRDPKLLLEGTIEVVRACLAYSSIDNQPFDHFLRMQTYDPAKAKGADYALTFDIHGAATARILVGTGSKMIDLADLYGHPWDPYRQVGFSRVWLTHPDWTDLGGEEMTALEKAIEDDLWFDYTEDEISVWFEDEYDDRLILRVQDVLSEDGEEKDVQLLRYARTHKALQLI